MRIRNKLPTLAISLMLLLSVPQCASAAFNRDLSVGSRGESVRALQQFLVSNGFLTTGNTTGYFGRITLLGVRNFQLKNNIFPATGYFGSKTREIVNAKLSLPQQVQQATITPANPIPLREQAAPAATTTVTTIVTTKSDTPQSIVAQTGTTSSATVVAATATPPVTPISKCAGDGTQDDTSCIQNAITTAASAGGSLTFPENKTYTISKRLRIPSNFSLNGSNSKIQLKSPEIMLSIDGSNVTILNLQLDYQATSMYAGIIDFGPDVSNVIISGCQMTGREAVAAIHLNNPRISNVTIRGNTMRGMYYGVLVNTTNPLWTKETLSVLGNHTHAITIEGNTISDVRGDGIEVNTAVLLYQPYNSGTVGVAANDIKIASNIISAPYSDVASRGFCVGIAGAFNVSMYGNTLQNCKWQFVHIEDTSHDITIAGNQMKTIVGNKSTDISGWQSDRAGILLLNSKRVYLLNNTIEGTVDQGIDITYDATTYNTDTTISQNTIKNTGGPCIRVAGPKGQDLKTWIGPVPSFTGNTTINCGGVPVQVAPDTTGVVIMGNLTF